MAYLFTWNILTLFNIIYLIVQNAMWASLVSTVPFLVDILAMATNAKVYATVLKLTVTQLLDVKVNSNVMWNLLLRIHYCKRYWFKGNYNVWIRFFFILDGLPTISSPAAVLISSKQGNTPELFTTNTIGFFIFSLSNTLVVKMYIFAFRLYILQWIYVSECPVGYTGNQCDIRCRYPSFGYLCQFACNCSKERCNFTKGCDGMKC